MSAATDLATQQLQTLLNDLTDCVTEAIGYKVSAEQALQIILGHQSAGAIALADLNAMKAQATAIINAVDDESLINQVVENNWFKDGSLRIGNPESGQLYPGKVGRYDNILSGYLRSGLTNYGDFNGKDIVANANIWVHFPYEHSASQMLAFTVRNYQFQGNEEEFKCNNYTISNNTFAHADDPARFKFRFYDAATLGSPNGKYYLSIFFPSAYYVSSQVSAIKGRQDGVLTREQFGIPEFSLSDTPTGNTL